MKIFCKHQWEKVTEITLPSTFQQINAMDIKDDGTKKELLHRLLRRDFFEWHQTKYILVLKCKLCGRLDKTTINNGRW